jgi:hypothetical protein
LVALSAAGADIREKFAALQNSVFYLVFHRNGAKMGRKET